ncbi:hypothetical protein HYH38_08420 [Clostridium botulinum]|uniref:hypothetical protein n=1 Tax=Clostridium botulinum TaxID=1491 RepID=UPI001C9ADF0A|nr:hypothetical protein [Clostridium botulinum]MBY6816441.1 hypothetical protein [Clostridium botulinum]MBY6827304.1 hypothetical protein [Clostridium botulinum]MBY6859252.1 hypothetical protein [Clostridium botulinum]MBY7041464.1 hypothetical protein [Clostridium botulinum]
MNKDYKGFYIAKTLRMMNYLAKKFDCMNIQKDESNPKFSVFLFKDSKELREYLKEYRK